MVILDVLKLILVVIIAFFVGKLVSKIKLPAILGWLITGMILGPHAFSIIDNNLLDATWYNVLESILECTVGLMIGTELIWRKMKKAGKQIVVTTITESIGTFIVVSLVFGVIFWFTNVPIYLAFMFGGIALATAPAPSLSIVNDMKTSGPVTKTLIPMAALDDLVGALVFFTVIAIVSAKISTQQVSIFMVLFMVFLPVILGIITGFITGLILKKVKGKKASLAVLVSMLLFSAALGLVLNLLVLPSPTLNFLLLGMGFSTVFSNMIEEEQLNDIMKVMNPIIGISLIVVILNIGSPLDYHLILGAGVYTAVYIVARAIGKYSGGLFWRCNNACAKNGKAVFRIYVTASLRCIARIYRYSGFCASGPGAGMCANHTGNNRCRSSNQRNHRSVYGEKGI